MFAMPMLMKNRMSLLVAVALLAASCTAQAQSNDLRHRYKWKDAQGNLHIEDAIPPSDAKLGYDIVNAQGLIIRHIERQRTEEELAAAKAAMEKAEVERRTLTEQSSRDTQMMAAYPDENELRKAQESQLTMVQQNIDTSSAGIKSQEKSLAEMLAHAAEAERDNKPVSPAMQQRIAKLKSGIAEQKLILEKRERERVAMQKQFEVELAHYREVKAHQEAMRKGDVATKQ
jgi:hypothetical protein